jgi:sporulation protein YlmC with PRC-barrel domain
MEEAVVHEHDPGLLEACSRANRPVWIMARMSLLTRLSHATSRAKRLFRISDQTLADGEEKTTSSLVRPMGMALSSSRPTRRKRLPLHLPMTPSSGENTT